MATTPKPRRRWFRFSLRTLLVLMLLACIGMGWLGVKMQQVRRQRDAVAAMERLGGVVHWVHDYPDVGLQGKAWLRQLLGDDFFAHPDIVEIRNDAAIECLKEVSQAPTLILSGRRITDAELGHLKGVKDLQAIHFIDTPQVTNDGLRHLKELTQLTALALNGSQITDAGLEHLKRLTQLRRLGLSDTQVSDSGVSRLKQALPNCCVFR